MARLLIPTRNRSTSLAYVLSFLARFYGGTQVLIADGSTPQYQERNRHAVEKQAGNLRIELIQYPESLPLFDRLQDVLKNANDAFFIMGSDDDYPMMEVFEKGEKRLRKNEKIVTALGALLHLRLFDDHTMNARIDPARPIFGNSAHNRMLAFSKWPNSTMYAVSRRELLLERYKRAKVMMPGFFDYAVGLLDCAMGNISSMPTIGFICTRNYNHSYLRAEAPLFYLRQSKSVLKLKERIRADLVEYGRLDDERADRFATLVINRRVAVLAGAQPYKVVGFEDSRAFNNDIVQSQYSLFHNLFLEDTSERREYMEKLMYISEAILGNAKSGDNADEKPFYENLDEM